MRIHYEEIRALGGEVLVICFAQPVFLAFFERDQRLPFPIVTDPSRRAYQRFGLEQTTWLAMLSGKVLWRYLRFLLRGWTPQRGNKGEDILQLGGDFVLDRERRLVFAHRSAEPTDRPRIDRLLEALSVARPT